MLLVSRKSFFILVILAFLAIAGLAGLIWSGIYDVAADVSHSRPVYTLLETARERSIEVRASKLTVPDLTDKARIIQGAGNYNAMCMGCHLAPGMAETELSKGLYPAPPNLSKVEVGAAESFWVIKHGVKASGMAAWGKSMDDEYIWNMVAFLQQLPGMTPEQYEKAVASSGGHSHGGGETRPHEHAEGAEDDHHAGGDHHDASPAQGPDSDHAEQGMVHTHADGKKHVHKPAAPAKASTAGKPTPPAQPAPSSAASEAAPEPKPAAEAEPTNHDAHEHHH